MKKCCRWCFLIRDEVPLSIRTRLVGATSIEFISKLIVFILGRWWSRFFVAKCWLQACQRKQSRELRAIITKIHTIGGLHRISGRRKKVKKIYLKLSSWAARRVKLWTRAHRCLGMRKTAVATRLAFHGEKIFFFCCWSQPERIMCFGHDIPELAKTSSSSNRSYVAPLPMTQIPQIPSCREWKTRWTGEDKKRNKFHIPLAG